MHDLNALFFYEAKLALAPREGRAGCLYLRFPGRGIGCLKLCEITTRNLTRCHPTSLVFPLAFPLSKPFVISWLQS